jgi:hypothetical protein
MSRGRMGSGGMSLIALGVVVLLALVFYGLNGRDTTPSQTAQSTPPATLSHPTAPHG